MGKSIGEKVTLFLALIAGFSINGAYAALFNSIVPFSIFPLIALLLSVYCLHQHYLNRTMPQGVPKLVAACFLLGILLYSTFIRAQYPQIGSNLLPVILCVILVLWIGIKLKSRGKPEDIN